MDSNLEKILGGDTSLLVDRRILFYDARSTTNNPGGFDAYAFRDGLLGNHFDNHNQLRRLFGTWYHDAGDRRHMIARAKYATEFRRIQQTIPSKKYAKWRVTVTMRTRLRIISVA